MKPISTARTAFYTIFFVVIILTLTASAAPRDNLPEIDLPDFVISGVEQATLVRGDRLSYNALSPEITTPDILISSRPEMSTHSVNIVQSRPEVAINPDRSYKYADVYAGNIFGGGTKFGLGTSWKQTIVSGSGWYNSPPRLFEFGESSNIGAHIGVNIKFFSNVILNLSSKYSSTQFHLPEPLLLGGPDNDWRDIILSGNLTPLLTTLGSFSGRYKFNHWSLNQFDDNDGNDLSANQSAFSLTHEIYAFKGQFETTFDGLFEPLEQNSKNLTLLKGKISFGWWEPNDSRLRIGFGLNVYSGNSTDTDEVSGVQPQLKVMWNTIFDGLVFLRWNPNAYGHSLRTIMNDFPMLSNYEGSSIAVDKAKVEVGYEMRIFNSTNIGFQTTYSNTENYPIIDPIRNERFPLKYVQIESISLNLDIEYDITGIGEIVFFASFERMDCKYPVSHTFVNDELQGPFFYLIEPVIMKPFIVGLTGNGRWQKWQLSSDLSWHYSTRTVYESLTPIRSHLDWDLAVGYNLQDNIRVSIVGLNILSNDFAIFEYHKVTPFTLMLKGSFGTNLSILDNLLF